MQNFQSYTIKCSYPTTIILDASIEVNEGELEPGVDHATGNINEIFQLGIFRDVDFSVAIGDSGISLGDHVYATLTSTVVPSEIDWYIKYCKVSANALFYRIHDNFTQFNVNGLNLTSGCECCRLNSFSNAFRRLLLYKQHISNGLGSDGRSLSIQFYVFLFHKLQHWTTAPYL